MGFTWPWYNDVQEIRQQLEARMGATEDRLAAVESKLQEASVELPALIQQLRDEIAANEVQESTLAAIESLADGLANVVKPPAEPPVEPPAPPAG